MDIKCGKVDVKIAGSGTVMLANVTANEVKSDIAGSGDFSVTGTAESVEFDIAGSGDINALALIAKKGKVKIAGSGNVDCNVDNLIQTIMGSGKVKNARK